MGALPLVSGTLTHETLSKRRPRTAAIPKPTARTRRRGPGERGRDSCSGSVMLPTDSYVCALPARVGAFPSPVSSGPMSHETRRSPLQFRADRDSCPVRGECDHIIDHFGPGQDHGQAIDPNRHSCRRRDLSQGRKERLIHRINGPLLSAAKISRSLE